MTAGHAAVIGTVELDQVTGILVEETRKLVRQPWPGAAGDLLQDLGKSAARIRIYGVANGDGAADRLTGLRSLVDQGEAVDFTASDAVPASVSQVMIASCKVYQPPGFINYYEYELDLIQYVPVAPARTFGFTSDALSSLKSGLHLSALDEISGAVSALGKAKGRLQDIEDAMQATKAGLSMLKDGLNLFEGLDVLRKVIKAGDQVVDAAKS